MTPYLSRRVLRDRLMASAARFATLPRLTILEHPALGAASTVLVLATMLLAPPLLSPHYTYEETVAAQVAQCIEDHNDRGPLAPDINTTCETDSECKNPEDYCQRAIASGCSDPDDYTYTTECHK